MHSLKSEIGDIIKHRNTYLVQGLFPDQLGLIKACVYDILMHPVPTYAVIKHLKHWGKFSPDTILQLASRTIQLIIIYHRDNLGKGMTYDERKNAYIACDAFPMKAKLNAFRESCENIITSAGNLNAWFFIVLRDYYKTAIATKISCCEERKLYISAITLMSHPDVSWLRYGNYYQNFYLRGDTWFVPDNCDFISCENCCNDKKRLELYKLHPEKFVFVWRLSDNPHLWLSVIFESKKVTETIIEASGSNGLYRDVANIVVDYLRI